MKKYIPYFLACFGFAVGLGGTSAAWARSYTLGLVEWLPWATAYVAQENGFWQEQGLDIEIRQFSNYATEHLSAFKYGKTDFAIMMMGDTVNMIARRPGVQRIIYEHDWSHGSDMFILAKEQENLEEIKGKMVGVYNKSAPIAFFINQVLAGSGLSAHDVKLVEISNNTHLNEAFRQGKFAAIVSYDPDASKVIVDGTGKAIATSADFPGVIPESLAVQLKVLEEEPEVVEKFMYGWLKALHWQSQPENRTALFALANRTMCRKTPYSDAELAVFFKGAKFHTELADIIEQNSNGAETYIKKVLAFLKESGVAVQSEKLQDYIDTRIAVEQARLIFP